jgi:Bardet-Biedl syndrome 2 protein
MPLTAAFSFRLKDQILENTACVGLYDGERPTLTAATTGGKIFMFDPYARADEHGSDAGGASRVRYLNINKKITAVAAGALGAAHDGRDILFVGTGTDVLAYDVDTNTDVFFRDAPEGASSLRRATANAAENVPPLLLVGGNCSLQGLDATGEEAFWTVASDVVTSLGVFADGTIAVGTEDGAVRACVVAADGSERVAFEVREADAVTHIVPHDAHRGESWKEKNGPEDGRLFAFASRDGSVGARDGATLLWREKRGAAKRATCAAAFDLTGDGSPEICVGFADGTMEVRVFRTGEVLFEDAFDAPLAAIVVAETKKQRLESKSNAAGDLLACAADGEVRGYRAKGSGEGAVVPALGFGADASKGKGK